MDKDTAWQGELWEQEEQVGDPLQATFPVNMTRDEEFIDLYIVVIFPLKSVIRHQKDFPLVYTHM